MGKTSWQCKNINNRCDKNTSKRAIQITEETTGNLIGNKIAGKITSVSKNSKKPQYNEVKD